MKVIQVIFITLLGFSVLLIGCDDNIKNQSSWDDDIGVAKNHEALQYFTTINPNYKIIKCAEEDVSGNKLKDLIIIFNGNIKQNSMVVIINKGNGDYEISERIPAPAENQKIQFKDIDKKPPMEFIVSGSKGSNFGLGIFRLEGLNIIDIYGDGMEDCC